MRARTIGGGRLAFLLGLGLALPALAHSTERVSIDSAGTQAGGFSFDPAISADGRYVAFDSAATNLVADDTNGAQDIFVHDRGKP
jgi:hypothetical protein